MKTRSPKLPLALLALALTVPALAHDTWLLARSSAVQPGTSVVFDLTSSMAFPANETALVQGLNHCRIVNWDAALSLPLPDEAP